MSTTEPVVPTAPVAEPVDKAAVDTVPSDKALNTSDALPKITESTPATVNSDVPLPVIPDSAPAAASTGPTWPDFKDDHPLAVLLEKLPTLLKDSGHSEVYGIPLKPKTDSKADFHTLLILQKFLRANANDLPKAEEQLLSTLKWRKEFDPVKAASETFPKDKFEGLGYVTEIDGGIVTWNIYGAVKDYEKTFVPVDEFLRWRIALMEMGVSKLKLAEATTPIPDYGAGPDPYQGIQVHDYSNVSFLRMDPRAKAASKKTIELLGAHYPETLSRKFFVNVPLVMQWMFSAMKLFVNKNTTGKFAVLSYGSYVSAEIGSKSVPVEYGGEGSGLSSMGVQLKLE